jgi:prephenate dehydrogenase
MFEQLGLIGCGLMGGSFALALKRAGLVKRVVGFSPSPNTTERARQMGVIDQVASTAEQAAQGSDLVLVAVPVGATESTFAAIQHLISPQMLVMDVGSTKGDVVAMGRRALGEKIGAFVPAHPIAGKEVSGIEHADADLYAGKQVILTPIESTRINALKRALDVWTALGCQVVQMSPKAHDAAYAAVSHLPLLLSFAMMNAVSSQAQGEEFLSLAGPGFRDFTRIAASDAKVWRDIMLSNREEILAQSRVFQEKLKAMDRLIESGDGAALEVLIGQASLTRAKWHMVQNKK